MNAENILEKVKKSPLVRKYINGELVDKVYFINADGGYGKTTALNCLYYYLVNMASSGNHIVPIFIDVKLLMDFGDDRKNEGLGNMPRPLERYIVRNYCGQDIDPKETLLEKVINLFSNNSPKFNNEYTYCIFVDGINEVDDSTKRTILTEIKEMLECGCVKFFISSRIDEKEELPDETVKCKLIPLEEDSIRQYLDKNFGNKYGEKVDISKINDSLVEILQVPMYLSVFRKIYDKKTPYPDIYEQTTVRKADLLDSYVQKILKDNKEKTRKEYNPIIEFVIKYYLPALAFKAYKSNFSMQISDKKFRYLRKDINYFDSLLVPDELIDCCKLNNTAIKGICLNLGLVHLVNGFYTFTHQNWRDLFAAKHIINCMNAEKLDELEKSFYPNIRQFVGELIREYDNKFKYSKNYDNENDNRKCECDFEKKDNLKTWSESPIEYFFQKHYSLLNKNPIVIRNLIDIMKTSRNNHITAKYDGLDLKYVSFYKCNLKGSTFNKTILLHNCFFSTGHNSQINAFCLSIDGSLLVTGDINGVLYVWDYMNRTAVYQASFNDPICIVEFSPNNEKIAVLCENSLNIIRYKKIDNEMDFNVVNSENIKNDFKVAISWSNDELCIVSYDDNMKCIHFNVFDEDLNQSFILGVFEDIYDIEVVCANYPQTLIELFARFYDCTEKLFEFDLIVLPYFYVKKIEENYFYIIDAFGNFDEVSKEIYGFEASNFKESVLFKNIKIKAADLNKITNEFVVLDENSDVYILDINKKSAVPFISSSELLKNNFLYLSNSEILLCEDNLFNLIFVDNKAISKRTIENFRLPEIIFARNNHLEDVLLCPIDFYRDYFQLEFNSFNLLSEKYSDKWLDKSDITIKSISLSNSKKYLAFSTPDELLIYDLYQREYKSVLNDINGYIYFVSWSNTDKFILYAYLSGSINIFNKFYNNIININNGKEIIDDICWGNDDGLLVLATHEIIEFYVSDGEDLACKKKEKGKTIIRLYNIDDMSNKNYFISEKEIVLLIRISYDNKNILAYLSDGNIILINTSNYKRRKINVNNKNIIDIKFMEDSNDFICVDKLGKSYIYSIGKKCLIKSCVKKTTLEKNSHNVLYCEKNNFLMSTVLNENIYNCDFRNSKYIGNDEDEFYKTIYSNGGLIKKSMSLSPYHLNIMMKINIKEKIYEKY